MQAGVEKLRVLHYPQPWCKAPFIMECGCEAQASIIIDLLKKHMLWLFRNNVIPGYVHTFEVEMLYQEEWVPYFNYDEFMEFVEFEIKYIPKK